MGFNFIFILPSWFCASLYVFLTVGRCCNCSLWQTLQEPTRPELPLHTHPPGGWGGWGGEGDGRSPVSSPPPRQPQTWDPVELKLWLKIKKKGGKKSASVTWMCHCSHQQLRRAPMVSSSPTTTATSAWETRTPTGRRAKPKSWCPAPTADALVSLCSTLLHIICNITNVPPASQWTLPPNPEMRKVDLSLYMCMLNANTTCCFLESFLYNQPYDAAALEKIMISKYNMGPFARLICPTAVLIFWSLRTKQALKFETRFSLIPQSGFDFYLFTHKTSFMFACGYFFFVHNLFFCLLSLFLTFLPFWRVQNLMQFLTTYA